MAKTRRQRRSRLGTVKVGSLRIPVRRRKLPRSTWGMTYLEDPEPEIKVSSRLRSPRSILGTTLHEMLHHLRPRDREREIVRLERELIALIRSNKSFFHRLTDAV